MLAPMKPTLAELQGLVLKGIAAHDDAALGLVRTPPNDTAEVMFGVYRNAYILRLTEFLSNDHPQLKAYLGDDAFFEMSKAYAAAHPSDTPNARWYSRHLPEFLARHEPWSQHRELTDLAKIERGLIDSFDSVEAPVATVDDLQKVDPERFDEAVLELHPALRRIGVTSNALAIWLNLKREEEPPAAELCDPPRTVITWRQDGAAKVRELEAEEAMALDSAGERVPFGVLCEMIAMMGDPDTAAMRAATYLRQWIDSEMVRAIAVPAAGRGI
jgi:hypothetical protein